MNERGSSSRQRVMQGQSPRSDADSASGKLPAPTASTAESASLAHASQAANAPAENREAPAENLAPLETQPTVITKAPLAQYPLGLLHPRDMGRVLEGESLGHFELIEYVGGGGMGAVFRALDTMLNRTVAVKVLSQEQSGDDETLRRFQNEAQSAARLDHENISRVHYVGEDRGWHYIVFEFIDGANVRDLVYEQGPLPLVDAVSYTLQLADALVHASGREVVHRDIKPSNVLITPDGRAKLVDMGLARQHHVEADNNDLTASGVTLGTFDYISPEQARDPRSADVRSDIYSLGCTLYFILTGRPPFPEGTVLQKLLQHQGDEPADPRTFRPELPEDLIQIMRRMLAKSPDKRFASPAELVAELAAFAQRHGLPATPTTSVVWMSPEQMPVSFWERHLPWIVPLAVLVLLVAVMNLFWSHDSGTAAPPPLHPEATTSDQTITGDQTKAAQPADTTNAPEQAKEKAAAPTEAASRAPSAKPAVSEPPAHESKTEDTKPNDSKTAELKAPEKSVQKSSQ
jgi:serine/threonine protein kinase